MREHLKTESTESPTRLSEQKPDRVFVGLQRERPSLLSLAYLINKDGIFYSAFADG